MTAPVIPTPAPVVAPPQPGAVIPAGATPNAPAPATTPAAAPVPVAERSLEERQRLAREAMGNSDKFAEWIGLKIDASTGEPGTAAAPEKPAAETKPADSPTAPAKPGEKPAGEAAADTKPADEKKTERPAGALTLLGADGQPLELDPALTKVKGFKANGEETEVTLADLVRRAQSESGANAHASRMEQRARSAEDQLYAAQNAMIELQTMGRRLLFDEAYRAELAKEVDPATVFDQQGEASKENLRRAHEERAHADYQRAASGVAQNAIPFITQLAEQHPEVPLSEVFDRLRLDTAHLNVPGTETLAPQHLAAFVQYLQRDLPHWVRRVHTERTARLEAVKTETTKREEALAAERTRAQADAQDARNALAAAVRPTGGVAGAAQPGKPEFRSIADREEYARGAFANVGSG